jgi:hypothetical protein
VPQNRLDFAVAGSIYPPRQGRHPASAAVDHSERYRSRTMSIINPMKEFKRMDNIDAMLRGRFAQPTLRELFYRQVIARRKRG